MSAAHVIKTVRETIERHALFARGARVVVGVSGGADSMALLHLLAGFQRGGELSVELHVAHLNHALRGVDSDEDAVFVEAAADALNLTRTVEVHDVRSIARAEKGSLEQIARRERYAFFERVAVAWGATTVAVAHHADDNAETVLHRILRGTGLRGVSGIAVSRPLRVGGQIELVRPLLGVRRAAIRRYVADEGVVFREDASNLCVDQTRNLIRHELLPVAAQKVNPQVTEALLRLAEQAGWVEQYLRETARRTLDTLIIARTDQQLVLNASALARKSRIVQTELIREAILLFELGEQHLGFGHIKGVADMIAGGRSGQSVSLPAGMTATRVYDRLILSAPSEEPREYIAPEVAVHLPGTTRLVMRKIQIACEVVEVVQHLATDPPCNANPMQEWMDWDSIHPPLVVRSRRLGDRFRPLGAPGSKTIADFLSDAKIDPAKRDQVAVLCDQLGPIWIVGHRIDERVKLTRATRRALHVRVTPL